MSSSSIDSSSSVSRYFLDDEALTALSKEVASGDNSKLHDLFQLFSDEDSPGHPFFRDCPVLCLRAIEIANLSSLSPESTTDVETASKKDEGEDIIAPQLTQALIKKVVVQFARCEVFMKAAPKEDGIILCKEDKNITFNSTIFKFSSNYFYKILSNGMEGSKRINDRYTIDLSTQYSKNILEIVKSFFYTSKINPIKSIDIAMELYDFGRLIMEPVFTKASAQFFKKWSASIQDRENFEIYIDIMNGKVEDYKQYFSSPIEVVKGYFNAQNIAYGISKSTAGIVLSIDELYLFKKLEKNEKIEEYLFALFKGFFVNQIEDFEKIGLLSFMDKRIRNQVTEIAVPYGLNQKQLHRINKLFPNINFMKVHINFSCLFDEVNIKEMDKTTWRTGFSTSHIPYSINKGIFNDFKYYKEFKSIYINILEHKDKYNYLIIDQETIDLLPQLPGIKFSNSLRITLKSIDIFEQKFQWVITNLRLLLKDVFNGKITEINEENYGTQRYTQVVPYLNYNPH